MKRAIKPCAVECETPPVSSLQPHPYSPVCTALDSQLSSVHGSVLLLCDHCNNYQSWLLVPLVCDVPWAGWDGYFLMDFCKFMAGFFKNWSHFPQWFGTLEAACDFVWPGSFFLFSWLPGGSNLLSLAAVPERRCGPKHRALHRGILSFALGADVLSGLGKVISCLCWPVHKMPIIILPSPGKYSLICAWKALRGPDPNQWTLGQVP